MQQIPLVDLSRISALTEIILRAGDASDQSAHRSMQDAYVRPDPDYPGLVGLSTLFRPGASLDQLARAGAHVFRHRKLSYSVIARVQQEFGAVGYELVLYVTPNAQLADHHTLAVARAGSIQPALPDDAAEALIRALTVVDNPYRPHP